jgi:hypothetical protein
MIVLGIFLVLIFILSLVSPRLKKTILTVPMVCTTAGILLVLIVHELELVEVESKTVRLLAAYQPRFLLMRVPLSGELGWFHCRLPSGRTTQPPVQTNKQFPFS